MSPETTSRSGFEIRAENIGGIDETTVEFQPGVTVLVGRNASNRTSLLQAFMASLGSTDVSIKGDADHGEVTLQIGDATYTRRLSRDSSGVHATGDPYLDDPETAELFAFLLESNEARQAVITGSNLRDIIMRPVDVDAINDEIAERKRERERLDDELESIADQKGTLPELEQRRTQLEDEIATKEAAIREKQDELDSFDVAVTETRADQSELESKLETLRETRSDLEDVRYEIETQRERKEALRQERREVEERLDGLDAPADGALDELETHIDRLTEQKAALEAELDEIRGIIEFNQGMLDGDAPEFDPVEEGSDAGALTDQLLEDEQVRCWTCGSRVAPDSIEATITRLRELSQNTFGELEDVKAELSDCKEKRQRLQETRETREQLDRRLNEVESELETADETLESQRERRETLTEDVATIEEEVESLEEDVYSDLLDVHREANQLEYELEQLESNLQEVTERIQSLEDNIAREDDLRAQREAVQSEITDLRTKIERIETAAVERFNESIETVLQLLEYENLDRIWIEPVEQEVREGRTKTTARRFELHVVRQSDSGTTYKDTLDHVSESEREVTGLVFALAGYLAHDVAEEVPFLLLDSLEAIDSGRIAALIRYLAEYPDHLIVALLPQDADALDETFHRITDI